LIWARRLVEADEDDLSDTAERFLAYWTDEFALHLAEEEQVILPVYQRHVDLAEDEQAMRLVGDHAWLRDAIHGLRTRLEAADPVDPHREAIGQRLESHLRFEDRKLFPAIETQLADAELVEVHERSRAFRREHRGEHAIGPRS
jgi:hemerythrin-like domain-containing protein